VTEFQRIPAPYLENLERRNYVTSEMRKYKSAYVTPDRRWLIQKAYGACGGAGRSPTPAVSCG
jgi:hypothetical protein